MPRSGWHLVAFGGPSELALKMASFSKMFQTADYLTRPDAASAQLTRLVGGGVEYYKLREGAGPGRTLGRLSLSADDLPPVLRPCLSVAHAGLDYEPANYTVTCPWAESFFLSAYGPDAVHPDPYLLLQDALRVEHEECVRPPPRARNGLARAKRSPKKRAAPRDRPFCARADTAGSAII